MRDMCGVLVVEDDADLAAAVQSTLSEAGYLVEHASDGASALLRLERGAYDIGLVLADARMRPMDGYSLLGKITSYYPGLPVVMMTAFGTVRDAVGALRRGACDYLEKPFEASTLLTTVQQNMRRSLMEGMVAESPVMQRLVEYAKRVAPTNVSVMLTGPSGSGKEIMARFIHKASDRSAGPFVAINCAAIPESLLEATLMGHEKGAFTGAVKTSPGKFEQANNGTILLDEITEMPIGMQPKLLRVLQEREVERVGGNVRIPLNVRVIATSNRDLRQAVTSGVLREDLYYRLNVFPLEMRPLAERREDIIPLAEHALARYGEAHDVSSAGISEGAKDCLLAYHWPGNVRELENVLQRAVVLAGGGEVLPSHLGLPAVAPNPESTLHATGELSETRLLAEYERIADALMEARGAKAVAARALGISPRTLRQKMQKFRDAGLPAVAV